MLIKILKDIRNKIYHGNDNNYYYGSFKGGISFWKLFLFNICYPGRFFNQLRFGQIKYLNYLKNKKKDKNFYSNIELKKKFNELNNNGSITINSFFSKELIDKFKKDYSNEINFLQSKNSDHNKYFKVIGLKIKKSLIELWLNKEIISLMTHYMGTNIFARNYPTLNYSVGKSETNSKIQHKNGINTAVSDTWHVDHSTLISVHVFLDEVKKDGTCMEFLKGSNKFLNSFFSVSDEIISESNLEKKQCYGDAGSINIHCGNVVHRMRPKPNSNRLMLTFGFTTGSNIMLDVQNIAKCLNSDFSLENLNQSERDVLKGIFPKKLSKGYDLQKRVLKPTTYTGI